MRADLTWQEAFADPVILLELVSKVGNGGYVAVLRELGIRPNVHYYDRLRDACHTFGIPEPKYVRPRKIREAKEVKQPRRSAFYDAQRVRTAAAYGSPNTALRYLGFPACGGNYQRLREACDRYGVPYPAARAMSQRASRAPGRQSRIDPVLVLAVARTGATIYQACERLDLPATKYYRDRVSKIAREGGVPLKRKLPRPRGSTSPRIPLLELLERGAHISQGQLRRRLVAEGVLEYKCSTPHCAVAGAWLGKPITLQLDHINGDPTDNRLENLRFLCPNCHTQTPTYNRGKGRRVLSLVAA